MDKKYSDSEVRGERSNHPENLNIKVKDSKLYFTQQAKEKYRELTGSQRTFIDRELDDLKFGHDNSKDKMVNYELDQALVWEKDDQAIIITDIVYQPYRDSKKYQKAQIRMKKMNN